MGRLTAEQSKCLLNHEGKNATKGLYIIRMSPEWKGFEIDYMEVLRGVLQVSTTTLTLRDDGRLTNGAPVFDNLNAFLTRYERVYSQQYSRSFPRLPAFRWDLSLKEVHSLVASLPQNAYIIRLSQSQVGNISVSYNTKPKPAHHLIALSAGTTYTCQNTTYTDFETLLASANFKDLEAAIPTDQRYLGAAQPVQPTFFTSSEEQLRHLKRGTSGELMTEAAGSMYVMDDDIPNRLPSSMNTMSSIGGTLPSHPSVGKNLTMAAQAAINAEKLSSDANDPAYTPTDFRPNRSHVPQSEKVLPTQAPPSGFALNKASKSTTLMRPSEPSPAPISLAQSTPHHPQPAPPSTNSGWARGRPADSARPSASPPPVPTQAPVTSAASALASLTLATGGVFSQGAQAALGATHRSPSPSTSAVAAPSTSGSSLKSDPNHYQTIPGIGERGPKALQLEEDLILTIYHLKSQDRDHLLSLSSPNAAVQRILERLRELYLHAEKSGVKPEPC